MWRQHRLVTGRSNRMLWPGQRPGQGPGPGAGSGQETGPGQSVRFNQHGASDKLPSSNSPDNPDSGIHMRFEN